MNIEYNRAEQLLIKDKYNNNNNQMQLLVKDLENFLANYVQFDNKDYAVTTFISDSLVINIQVKVKSFRDIKIL